jgi:uncharacterized membrane protein YdbT with pleckstrin-like domain
MSAARGAPPGFASIGRYLLPTEQLFATVRQHPASLIQPVAASLGGILAAVVVTEISAGARSAEVVAWTLAALLIARVTLASASWFNRYIRITSSRVVLTSGLFSSTVKLVPLPNFAEMTFARSFGGRLLGFGTFTIEASGKAYLVINYIPYSEQVQLLLSSGIYPQAADLDDELADSDWDSAPRRASPPDEVAPDRAATPAAEPSSDDPQLNA